MPKKVLILVIVLGVILAGYIFVNKPSAKIVKDKKAEVTEDKEMGDAVIDEGETLTVDLKDVSGGTSSGDAIIIRDKDGLGHGITADLPEPTGTTFYEGWLVQQQPELKFFSTGDLIKEEDGTYSLSYNSRKFYEGYDFVVVTLETIKDATPEKHIIEGLAK